MNMPLQEIGRDQLSPRLKQSPEDSPLASCHATLKQEEKNAHPVQQAGGKGSLFSFYMYIIFLADF